MQKSNSEENQVEINLLDYIQAFLKIVYKQKKEDGAKLGSFILNEPQLKLYRLIQKMIEEEKPIRIIILKARQMGFSTLVEAIIFCMVTMNYHARGATIAHDDRANKNLLEMFKTFYNNLPDALKPSVLVNNTEQMVFDNEANSGLGSSITSIIATPNGIGRGLTLDYVHMSEYAFWKCDKNQAFSEIMQAVPHSKDSIVIIESTANGYDDFKTKWDKAVLGESDFEPLFVAWWEMQEYRRPYYGFELTEEEKELMILYHLDLEQISWRRWKIANDCGGDLNKFLQEFPACPEEAFVASGNCLFDLQAITARLKENPKPIKRGYFTYDYIYDSTTKEMTVTNPKFIEDAKGEVLIYEDVKEYYPYVTGGDPAGDGSDNAVFHVLDNTNGKQVCKYKTQQDADLFAKQCMAIGLYYNTALVNIETNYDAGIIMLLQKWNYPNMYRREVYDQIAKANKDAFGFRTTQITRPIILNRLKTIVRENIELISDYETLNEMKTFCLNASGKKYEAQDGNHDDHVLALAIAYESYESQQMPHSLIYSAQKKRKNWIEESIERQRKERRKRQWW